ncbi:MAG: zinc ribbon domain-containing protein [Clostridia bacterium]|nr:zinc ribbon domain-containing protein [Clostridia bacterium]
MFCNKCGNKISDSDIFCPKCGAKVADIEQNSTEGSIKEDNVTNTAQDNGTKKKGKAGIIITIIVLILLVAGGVTAFVVIKNTPKNNEDKSVSEVKNGDGGSSSKTSNVNSNADDQMVSFFNMKYENELSDKKKAILDYFDNDYFLLSSSDYDSLQRNTKIYKNAKVHSGIEVIKVLKSTDTECELVGLLFDPEDDGDGAMYTIGDKNQFKQKVLLKFNQQDERFIVGDSISFYGNYEDTTSVDIDGVSTILPTISASKVIKLDYSNFNSDNSHRFSLKDIEKVANYIFGNDIKVRQSVYGEDHNESQLFTYTVTLENQGNTNFRAFNMGRDYGNIFYSMKELNNEAKSIYKDFKIAADFEHFIVSSYDSSVKQVYIEYYDKNYNKLWQRKFDLTNQYETYNSIVMCFDYTKDRMAVNVENDLYLINLENGEDVFKPVLVGQATRVVMQKNGIVLLGTKSKDAIMKINYDGTIAQRLDVDTNMKITGAEIQYVDEKLVMKIAGYVDDGGSVRSFGQFGRKFIVMNEDGTIEMISSDNMGN